jgi:hypothetical protein
MELRAQRIAKTLRQQTPKPRPWLFQKPGKNGDAAFCQPAS